MTTNVKVGISLGSAGLALALGSVARYAWLGWHGIVPMHGGFEKALHLIILCLWIVVPPVWFALEPYLPHGSSEEDFRRRQDAGRKSG